MHVPSPVMGAARKDEQRAGDSSSQSRWRREASAGPGVSEALGRTQMNVSSVDIGEKLIPYIDRKNSCKAIVNNDNFRW